MITLYGIKNCDSVKKARKWLDQQMIEYHFHDIRADDLTTAMVNQWIEQVGWETVLNKRGTTWRKLDTVVQENINPENIVQLLVNNPTLIKRPVLDANGIITIGFNSERYQTLFN